MSVADRLRLVRERMSDAALRSGREPGSVRLVGVSKGVAAAAVIEAVEAGLGDLGENRVQEAALKIPAVNRSHATPPCWHLVGHLQTNKAKVALDLFDVVQSVDSLRIAETLSRLAAGPLPVLLEVQFAHTADRFGFDPTAVVEAFDQVSALANIRPTGLMAVAPLGLTEDETRRVFRTLRERRDEIEEGHAEVGPLELSMGMTEDFEIAIEEGATMVRIGRAIFEEGWGDA